MLWTSSQFSITETSSYLVSSPYEKCFQTFQTFIQEDRCSPHTVHPAAVKYISHEVIKKPQQSFSYVYLTNTFFEPFEMDPRKAFICFTFSFCHFILFTLIPAACNCSCRSILKSFSFSLHIFGHPILL